MKRVLVPIRKTVLFVAASVLLLAGQAAFLAPTTHAATLGSSWWDGSPTVTQDYGCTAFQELKGGPYGCPAYWHSGIDLGLGCGAPLYAPVDGAKIVNIGGGSTDGTDQFTLGSGLGPYYPTIQLPDGNLVLLGHVNPVTAPLNTPLSKGTVITTVGQHGYAQGCHLHFEVRPAGTPFNAGFINATTGKAYAYGIDPYSELHPVVNPGGWWNTPPTLSNGSIIFPGEQINLSAHFVDNNNGGLSQTNITVKNPSIGQDWHVINSSTSLGNGGATADISQAYTVPVGTTNLYVSFDVYSANGRFQKAPNGVRKFCISSPCDTSDVTGGSNNQVGGGGATCSTPPTTSANVTGNVPGNHGWWRSPASMTLSVNAPCGLTGLQTFYRINGGTRNTYSGSVAFNQQGIYNVDFYSIDGFGNIEGTKSTIVEIDWTPPVTNGSATGPRDTNGIFRDNVTVGLAATDNLSGVDHESYSLNGGGLWTTVPGANNSFVLSGNGVSRAQYYSVDVAGNTEQPPKDSGPIIINKYAVFSNATGTSLRFLNNTNSNVTGDIYSGGSTNIDWNTGSSFGTTFKTVGTSNTIGMFNTNTQVPPIQTGVPSVPMLSYPLSLYQSLANVVFPSHLVMDSVNSTINGTVYVNGDVDMYDVALNGPLSIVATGTITDNTTDSTYQTNDPHNGVLMYAGKNVNLLSTGNRNLGLVYAPSGTITVGTTGLNLNGSLVGSQIEVNSASGFNLSYSPAFSSSTYPLPLQAMGLVSPTGNVPALPSTPSLLSPLNGASVNKSGVTMVWNAGSGAVGYQLQASKSSTFSTIDYDVSTFSTANRANLASSATTYYWRVRSINRAGMSAWSSVGSFRTQ